MRLNVIPTHKKVSTGEWCDDTVAASSREQSQPGGFGSPYSSWGRRFGALQHSCCCGSGQQQELLFVPRESHHAAAELQAGLVPATGKMCMRQNRNFILMDPAAEQEQKSKLGFRTDHWSLLKIKSAQKWCISQWSFALTEFSFCFMSPKLN